MFLIESPQGEAFAVCRLSAEVVPPFAVIFAAEVVVVPTAKFASEPNLPYSADAARFLNP